MTEDGNAFDAESVVDTLQHGPDDVVTESLELPSALWARVVLEKPDDVDVAEYIENLIVAGLGEHSRNETDTTEVDVHLAPETWERLRLKALYGIQRRGKDPETAFWDHVTEHIETVPNVVVDGESVGPEDIVPDHCDNHTETEP